MFRKPHDRQREHQANERTFLAWLRTSVALIGFGFAIARFGLFLRQLGVAITHQETPINPVFNSEHLGISLVVFGIALIALATWRYNQVLWQIERGDYRPSRLIIWVITRQHDDFRNVEYSSTTRAKSGTNLTPFNSQKAVAARL